MKIVLKNLDKKSIFVITKTQTLKIKTKVDKIK